jgi:hypothetical protein
MGNPKTDTDFLLLSNIQKENQSIKVGDTLTYLSVEDNLIIGEDTDFGSAYDKVNLFSEQLTVHHSFKMKAGIISTSSLSVSENAVFDLKGKDGETPLDVMDGTSGDPGGEGKFYLGRVSKNLPDFSIQAAGGNGGNARNGTVTDQGGTGGDGGDGGKIDIIYLHPYAPLLEELKRIYSIKNDNDKIEAIYQLLNTYSSVPLLSPLTNAIQENPETGILNEVLDDIALRLRINMDLYKNSLRAKVDTSGGSYGVYGEGRTHGENGKDGDPTEPKINELKSIVDFNFLSDENFFPWVHPIQCQMLSEKAKINYFCLNPLNQDSIDDALINFKRLQEKTAAFKDLTKDDVLAKMWSTHEEKIHASNSVETLQNLYADSVLYLSRLTKGFDYYGYPYNHVPILSFEFCREQLNDLIQNFQVISEEYTTLLETAGDIEKTKSALTSARKQAEYKRNDNNNKLVSLNAKLTFTGQIISGYKTVIEEKAKLVSLKISKLKEDIEKYFDWNWDNLFSSLGSLAFAPESEVMWVTQGSKILFDGDTKITTNEGEQINKAYLISHIRSISKDVDSLKEGYSLMPDGSINPEDPGASKLIGDAESIENLIDQVSERIDEEDVVEALQDYVSTVVERNNQILTYNAIATLILQTIEEQKKLASDINQYNQRVINQLTTISPEYNAFVARMYFNSITQLFEMMYLTVRSYNFWALTSDNVFDFLGGNPREITYSTLLNSQNQIIGKYKDAVVNFGTSCSYFPATNKNKGIEYKLNALQVDFMKKNYETMIKIPLVCKETSHSKNPFAGLSNVRITKVRCYLNGIVAKPGVKNSEVLLNITHTGQEQITSRDNGTQTFSHDIRKVPFKYDFKKNKILIDGDFGVHYPEDHTPYALFGPFTTWKIEVDESYREQVDLENIEGIVLEFQGTCYSFN